jgi:hypothetical protein
LWGEIPLAVGTDFADFCTLAELARSEECGVKGGEAENFRFKI